MPKKTLKYTNEFISKFFRDNQGKHRGQYGSVPLQVQMTNDTAFLADWLQKNSGKLTNTEREYVERQLEASKYLDELEKTKESNKRSVSPSDVTFSGTSAKFNGVYQKSNQTSANGCWSVSMSLLLQSRGVDLPQEIIRSFRPNQSADKLDVKGLETPNQDKIKNEKNELVSGKSDIAAKFMTDNTENIISRGELITRVLPNTAMKSREFTFPTIKGSVMGAGKDTVDEKIIANEILSTVRDAIGLKRSPVSILFRGHYRTIEAVDIEKRTVTFKDSMGPDNNGSYTCTVDDIVASERTKSYGGGEGNICLSWLEDLIPDEKGNLDLGISDAKYEGGQLKGTDVKIGSSKDYYPNSVSVAGASKFFDGGMFCSDSIILPKALSSLKPYKKNTPPDIESHLPFGKKSAALWIENRTAPKLESKEGEVALLKSEQVKSIPDELTPEQRRLFHNAKPEGMTNEEEALWNNAYNMVVENVVGKYKPLKQYVLGETDSIKDAAGAIDKMLSKSGNIEKIAGSFKDNYIEEFCRRYLGKDRLIDEKVLRAAAEKIREKNLAQKKEEPKAQPKPAVKEAEPKKPEIDPYDPDLNNLMEKIIRSESFFCAKVFGGDRPLGENELFEWNKVSGAYKAIKDELFINQPDKKIRMLEKNYGDLLRNQVNVLGLCSNDKERSFASKIDPKLFMQKMSEMQLNNMSMYSTILDVKVPKNVQDALDKIEADKIEARKKAETEILKSAQEESKKSFEKEQGKKQPEEGYTPGNPAEDFTPGNPDEDIPKNKPEEPKKEESKSSDYEQINGIDMFRKMPFIKNNTGFTALAKLVSMIPELRDYVLDPKAEKIPMDENKFKEEYIYGEKGVEYAFALMDILSENEQAMLINPDMGGLDVEFQTVITYLEEAKEAYKTAGLYDLMNKSSQQSKPEEKKEEIKAEPKPVVTEEPKKAPKKEAPKKEELNQAALDPDDPDLNNLMEKIIRSENVTKNKVFGADNPLSKADFDDKNKVRGAYDSIKNDLIINHTEKQSKAFNKFYTNWLRTNADDFKKYCANEKELSFVSKLDPELFVKKMSEIQLSCAAAYCNTLKQDPPKEVKDALAAINAKKQAAWAEKMKNTYKIDPADMVSIFDEENEIYKTFGNFSQASAEVEKKFAENWGIPLTDANGNEIKRDNLTRELFVKQLAILGADPEMFSGPYSKLMNKAVFIRSYLSDPEFRESKDVKAFVDSFCMPAVNEALAAAFPENRSQNGDETKMAALFKEATMTLPVLAVGGAVNPRLMDNIVNFKENLEGEILDDLKGPSLIMWKGTAYETKMIIDRMITGVDVLYGINKQYYKSGKKYLDSFEDGAKKLSEEERKSVLADIAAMGIVQRIVREDAKYLTDNPNKNFYALPSLLLLSDMARGYDPTVKNPTWIYFNSAEALQMKLMESPEFKEFLNKSDEELREMVLFDSKKMGKQIDAFIAEFAKSGNIRRYSQFVEESKQFTAADIPDGPVSKEEPKKPEPEKEEIITEIEVDKKDIPDVILKKFEVKDVPEYIAGNIEPEEPEGSVPKKPVSQGLVPYGFDISKHDFGMHIEDLFKPDVTRLFGGDIITQIEVPKENIPDVVLKEFEVKEPVSEQVEEPEVPEEEKKQEEPNPEIKEEPQPAEETVHNEPELVYLSDEDDKKLTEIFNKLVEHPKMSYYNNQINGYGIDDENFFKSFQDSGFRFFNEEIIEEDYFTEEEKLFISDMIKKEVWNGDNFADAMLEKAHEMEAEFNAKIAFDKAKKEWEYWMLENDGYGTRNSLYEKFADHPALEAFKKEYIAMYDGLSEQEAYRKLFDNEEFQAAFREKAEAIFEKNKTEVLGGGFYSEDELKFISDLEKYGEWNKESFANIIFSRYADGFNYQMNTKILDEIKNSSNIEYVDEKVELTKEENEKLKALFNKLVEHPEMISCRVQLHGIDYENDENFKVTQFVGFDLNNEDIIKSDYFTEDEKQFISEMIKKEYWDPDVFADAMLEKKHELENAKPVEAAQDREDDEYEEIESETEEKEQTERNTKTRMSSRERRKARLESRAGVKLQNPEEPKEEVMQEEHKEKIKEMPKDEQKGEQQGKEEFTMNPQEKALLREFVESIQEIDTLRIYIKPVAEKKDTTISKLATILMPGTYLEAVSQKNIDAFLKNIHELPMASDGKKAEDMFNWLKKDFKINLSPEVKEFVKNNYKAITPELILQEEKSIQNEYIEELQLKSGISKKQAIQFEIVDSALKNSQKEKYRLAIINEITSALCQHPDIKKLDLEHSGNIDEHAMEIVSRVIEDIRTGKDNSGVFVPYTESESYFDAGMFKAGIENWQTGKQKPVKIKKVTLDDIKQELLEGIHIKFKDNERDQFVKKTEEELKQDVDLRGEPKVKQEQPKPVIPEEPKEEINQEELEKAVEIASLEDRLITLIPELDNYVKGINDSIDFKPDQLLEMLEGDEFLEIMQKSGKFENEDINLLDGYLGHEITGESFIEYAKAARAKNIAEKKEAPKQEIKEEPKEEVKEQPKQDIKEEQKPVIKQEELKEAESVSPEKIAALNDKLIALIPELDNYVKGIKVSVGLKADKLIERLRDDSLLNTMLESGKFNEEDINLFYNSVGKEISGTSLLEYAKTVRAKNKEEKKEAFGEKKAALKKEEKKKAPEKIEPKQSDLDPYDLDLNKLMENIIKSNDIPRTKVFGSDKPIQVDDLPKISSEMMNDLLVEGQLDMQEKFYARWLKNNAGSFMSLCENDRQREFASKLDPKIFVKKMAQMQLENVSNYFYAQEKEPPKNVQDELEKFEAAKRKAIDRKNMYEYEGKAPVQGPSQDDIEEVYANMVNTFPILRYYATGLPDYVVTSKDMSQKDKDNMIRDYFSLDESRFSNLQGENRDKKFNDVNRMLNQWKADNKGTLEGMDLAPYMTAEGLFNYIAKVQDKTFADLFAPNNEKEELKEEQKPVIKEEPKEDIEQEEIIEEKHKDEPVKEEPNDDLERKFNVLISETPALLYYVEGLFTYEQDGMSQDDREKSSFQYLANPTNRFSEFNKDERNNKINELQKLLNRLGNKVDKDITAEALFDHIAKLQDDGYAELSQKFTEKDKAFSMPVEELEKLRKNVKEAVQKEAQRKAEADKQPEVPKQEQPEVPKQEEPQKQEQPEAPAQAAPEIDYVKFGTALNILARDLNSTTGFFTKDSDEFKRLNGLMQEVMQKAGDFTKLSPEQFRSVMTGLDIAADMYKDHIKNKPIDNDRRHNRADIADKLKCVAEDFRSHGTKKYAGSVVEREECFSFLEQEISKSKGFNIPEIKNTIAKLMAMDIVSAQSSSKNRLASYDEKHISDIANKLAGTKEIAEMASLKNLRALVADHKENPGLFITKTEKSFESKILMAQKAVNAGKKLQNSHELKNNDPAINK